MVARAPERAGRGGRRRNHRTNTARGLEPAGGMANKKTRKLGPVSLTWGDATRGGLTAELQASA
jgi:hypothetical protein